ncbi:RluA family pseudouridine synthase [Marinilactibacillus psychrotolerans]|uniref:Pseudouridine synthase n=1 Tax=Marinilactibacillus psychrotolerans 42ea TaxID=1255609 RepID=A0A1R4KCU3_9LACT|nr:RluA family pseudouridine synthase [Marinilactibacillus psychrotolerans]GEQ33184.1 ribosomal large subunit pseudouridine synthase D [Marinilactibacillus psychrotolerans]SJN41992.1 Ribosomal large subunit pseudouridine synthase D [Marinilactibacillus psychrotolerans 42ea]
MQDHYSFTNEGLNERIDKFITDKITDASRSQIQSWIKAGLVTVNDSSVKANYKLQSEDKIEITIPEPEVIDAKPEDINIEIIYEDQDVVVVNKPQGMVVHPSIGHSSGTLVNALLYHTKDLSGINGKIRPGIVHRIDKDTSGLLMVAKNDVAHEKLSEQLKDKKAQREYIALVHGLIHHDKGTIDAPIGRDSGNRKKYAVVDNGKPSVTHFEVIERFNKFTLIKLILETGRTHQIRVHMNYIEHPLAGDPIYGPRKTIKGNGQFLHAETLGFTHPTTGKEMKFSSAIPEIFKETLEILRKQ